MRKKYDAFDKLKPEVQKAIKDYWKDVKAQSRERAKLRAALRG